MSRVLLVALLQLKAEHVRLSLSDMREDDSADVSQNIVEPGTTIRGPLRTPQRENTPIHNRPERARFYAEAKKKVQISSDLPESRLDRACDIIHLIKLGRIQPDYVPTPCRP